MTTFGLTLVFALLVGCVTAAATSVRSVSRIWLRHWAETQLTDGGATASPHLDRPHRLLLAAGTGIAALTFSLGALLGLREDRDQLIQHILVAALVLLVGGQLLPRAIGRRWATSLVPALMPFLSMLEALFGPILRVASRLARPLALRVPRPAPEPTDPLDDLLREGEMEGVGAPDESEIISGVVEFGEKTIGEVMTGRDQVVAVDRTADPQTVTRLVASSQFTRIPVYEGDLDRVVGIVHAFDVLAHPDAPLSTLRAAAWASTDEPCGAVMRRMLRERRHLAVVRGSTAETVGLVTLEDLVEELVGDIRDEHDEPVGTA